MAEGRVRRGLIRTFWLIGFLALAGACAWLLRSPYLSVTEVVITGAARADVEGALESSGITEGQPLIFVDVAGAEAALAADPWVAEATVQRDWPRRVLVMVRERYGVAWVETAAGWFYVSADGVPLESGDPPPNSPRVLATGLPPEEISTQRQVLGALELLDHLRADLSAVTVVSATQDELVATLLGLVVRLGLPEDMEAKARALAAVIDTGPDPGSTITLVAPSRPAVLPPDSEGIEEEDKG